MAGRANLNQLIKALPDSQLEAAEHVLTHLQERPQKDLEEVPRQLARAPSLYDADFYQWTQTQAAALRDKELKVLAHALSALSALDLDNLAEEIESLGKRDRRAVESYLEIILLHLLEWTCQLERRGRSSQKSLLQARHRLAKLLRENPSLANHVPRFLSEGYSHVRSLAAVETGLPLARFPEACPWSATQIIEEDFWPEE